MFAKSALAAFVVAAFSAAIINASPTGEVEARAPEAGWILDLFNTEDCAGGAAFSTSGTSGTGCNEFTPTGPISFNWVNDDDAFQLIVFHQPGCSNSDGQAQGFGSSGCETLQPGASPDMSWEVTTIN